VFQRRQEQFTRVAERLTVHERQELIRGLTALLTVFNDLEHQARHANPPFADN
jgi:hypothetical protein